MTCLKLSEPNRKDLAKLELARGVLADESQLLRLRRTDRDDHTPARPELLHKTIGYLRGRDGDQDLVERVWMYMDPA